MSRQDHEDQILLRQIAAGEAAALRALHQKLGRPLFSQALKSLGNASEAEEIVQDVFLSVWKSAHRFDAGKAKVFTWMTVLTRNKCIDKIRAKQRRIPAADTRDDDERDVAETAGLSAADELDQKERAEMVRAALERLPIEQRQAIELAFFSGMTHVQVAEKLNVSVGTAKSRIRYGFKRLRAILANRPDLTS